MTCDRMRFYKVVGASSWMRPLQTVGRFLPRPATGLRKRPTGPRRHRAFVGPRLVLAKVTGRRIGQHRLFDTKRSSGIIVGQDGR